jgi:hypothetical protein
VKSGIRTVAGSAVTVALKAKVGSLTPMDVEQLRVQAEELLDDDAPLRGAVFGFATQYELVRRSPGELVPVADALFQAVQLALRPDPPDLHRRDIHG